MRSLVHLEDATSACRLTVTHSNGEERGCADQQAGWRRRSAQLPGHSLRPSDVPSWLLQTTVGGLSTPCVLAGRLPARVCLRPSGRQRLRMESWRDMPGRGPQRVEARGRPGGGVQRLSQAAGMRRPLAWPRRKRRRGQAQAPKTKMQATHLTAGPVARAASAEVLSVLGLGHLDTDDWVKEPAGRSVGCQRWIHGPTCSCGERGRGKGGGQRSHERGVVPVPACHRRHHWACRATQPQVLQCTPHDRPLMRHRHAHLPRAMSGSAASANGRPVALGAQAKKVGRLDLGPLEVLVDGGRNSE